MTRPLGEPLGDPLGDDNRLGVEELAHPHVGQLAPIAGHLDSAEGKPGVGGDECVDKTGTCLQPIPGYLLSKFEVRGEDGGTEPELGVVGDADRVI